MSHQRTWCIYKTIIIKITWIWSWKLFTCNCCTSPWDQRFYFAKYAIEEQGVFQVEMNEKIMQVLPMASWKEKVRMNISLIANSINELYIKNEWCSFQKDGKRSTSSSYEANDRSSKWTNVIEIWIGEKKKFQAPF